MKEKNEKGDFSEKINPNQNAKIKHEHHNHGKC